MAAKLAANGPQALPGAHDERVALVVPHAVGSAVVRHKGRQEERAETHRLLSDRCRLGGFEGVNVCLAVLEAVQQPPCHMHFARALH